ncbi:MAG: hypothetical protein D6677_05585 [Calditrichaeota bacterium]|nr:MAG: hypothetical protein D6677_05585 [Calditrichota bacterium]
MAKQINTQKNDPNETPFSEETEKLFKRALRIMSWIVGVAFVSVLILPYFNNPVVDTIARYIFNTGLIVLLIFTVIEFVSDSVKKWIENHITKTHGA